MTTTIPQPDPESTTDRCAICRGASHAEVCDDCIAWHLLLSRLEDQQHALRELRGR